MEFLVVLVVVGLPIFVFVMVGAGLLPVERRESLRKATHEVLRSLPGRLMLLLTTAVALLIPLGMVSELGDGRKWRLQAVENELENQWGGQQRVLGPALYVPVVKRWDERVERVIDGELNVSYRPKVATSYQLVFPRDLNAQGSLEPRELHRGLYEVPVYDAQVTLQATFDKPVFPSEEGVTAEVKWDEAMMLVEVSDLSAVSGIDQLQWQGRELRPTSGVLGNVAPSSVQAPLGGFAGNEAQATVVLSLRGMHELSVAAAGEQTDVRLAGTWPSPSFVGFTLPEDRTVGESFEASWSIPGVARPLPTTVAVMENTRVDHLLGAHTVGVALVAPASAYASVERSMVYGVLVIGLTLLTLLVTEQGLGLALHPVQWGVNGLAMVTFYLVLLAGSEQLGFDLAYLLASILVAGLVGGYTMIATKSLKAGLAVSGTLGTLYACMSVMLQSEDQALWMGTGLVVVALVGLMAATRRLGRPDPA